MGIVMRHLLHILHHIDIGEDIAEVPNQMVADGREVRAGDGTDIVLHIDFCGIGDKRRRGQR